MSKKLSAEPKHTAAVAARVLLTLADELEREGVKTLATTDLKILARRLV